MAGKTQVASEAEQVAILGKAVTTINHDGIVYWAGDGIPADKFTDVQLAGLVAAGAIELIEQQG